MVSGGKGYVFQDRFKSTLIEKDAYLLQSIAYFLRNPLRAGIVRNVEDYIWSSIKTYYSDNTDSTNDIVDAEFVNDLFGTREELMVAIETIGVREPPVILTKYGEVLGNDEFLKAALKKYDRRKKPSTQGRGVQRQDEGYFDPTEKVIWEFEKIKGVKIDDIAPHTLEGKRQRGELLVLLKDRAGLKYKEIGEFDIFGDLKLSFLREIYRNMKRRGI
jgi:hypothetical protein